MKKEDKLKLELIETLMKMSDELGIIKDETARIMEDIMKCGFTEKDSMELLNKNSANDLIGLTELAIAVKEYDKALKEFNNANKNKVTND